MSSTPHLDELRRIFSTGDLAAGRAYHKEHLEILVAEAIIVIEQAKQQNTQKEE